MGAKIYTGQGIRVDDSSPTDIDSIKQYLDDYKANKRADAQLAMQMANHNFQMQTLRETKASADALSTYAGGGYNWQGLADGNNADVFADRLPDAGDQFLKFKNQLESNGVTNVDQMGFFQTKQQNDAAYMNMVIKRHNAIYDEVKRNNPYADEKDIHKYMQENFHGDRVYENAVQVYGEEAATLLNYIPQSRKTGWGEWGKSFFTDPAVKMSADEEGVGGGAKKGPGIAIAAGMGLKYADSRQVNRLAGEILKQAQADWKDPVYEKDSKGKYKLDKNKNKIRVEGSGLDSDAFKKKYNLKKSEFGKRGGEFTGTTKSGNILKQARGQSYLGRMAGWAGEKMPDVKDFASPMDVTTPKKAGKALKFGKQALPYAAGEFLGSGLAEAAGYDGYVGQVAGGAAGALGFNKVMKKLASPDNIKKISGILAKKAPGVAAKLGLSAGAVALPEGISSLVGLGGLAWTAYDLMQLAQEIPELYDALTGE